MHLCTWSGMRCPSKIWLSFCRPKAWKISPSVTAYFPKQHLPPPLRDEHNVVFTVPLGVGSILVQHSPGHPPFGLVLTKPPWRRMLLWVTVKPLRVSLVEPVAYLKDS